MTGFIALTSEALNARTGVISSITPHSSSSTPIGLPSARVGLRFVDSICIAQQGSALLSLSRSGDHLLVVQPPDFSFSKTENFRQDLVGVLADAGRSAGR